MHRCLGIVEVQHAIFRLLRVNSEPEGMAALAGLARTCRTFSNVALDVLWETLDSVVHLIRCLPTDLWKIEQDKLTFKRDILLSDWEIFFKYSSRVRSLCSFTCRCCCSCLGVDILSTLTQPPSYGPLVPYLKSLRWLETKEHIPLFQQLLAPSLVHVELPGFVLYSPAISMQLTSRCPSLRSLRTRDTHVPGSLAKIWGRRSEHRIRNNSASAFIDIDGCALDEAAIVHLSRLPSLVELSLWFEDDNLQLENLEPYMAPPAFASLESLTLQADELSFLTSLLKHMHFKPRSAVFTVLCNPTTPGEFHLFFAALAKACDPEQLFRIKLVVDSSYEWSSSDEREQVSLSTFHPLLAFPNVKTLTFDAMCNIFFDDETIDTVTQRWPKLTHLSLNASSRWGIPSRMTHRGLIMLLSRRASLTKFDLEVDFKDIDLPHSRTPTSRPGNGLVSRCSSAFFIESKIIHPTTIAAFLSDVCPKLTVDACTWSYEVDGHVYGEKWKEVNSLLPGFSAMKKQCVMAQKGNDSKADSDLVSLTLSIVHVFSFSNTWKSPPLVSSLKQIR